uniref:Defensin-6 n=1 Tax=Phascolarctos cinereus TaxID=38626 RepID=A0A6P5K591_PHACI|nr:defensin-6 [Phascolarctos cinereus]
MLVAWGGLFLVLPVLPAGKVHAQESEEEMLTQEESVAENQLPDLPFMDAEGSDIIASDPQQRKNIVCYCRSSCLSRELSSGSCCISGVYYRLCCR